MKDKQNDMATLLYGIQKKGIDIEEIYLEILSAQRQQDELVKPKPSELAQDLNIDRGGNKKMNVSKKKFLTNEKFHNIKEDQFNLEVKS